MGRPIPRRASPSSPPRRSGCSRSGGPLWETSAWFVPIIAVSCLRGRARIAVVALAPLSMLTYDTLTWLGSDDPGVYTLCWNAAYWLTVSTLVIAGTCASARLVPIVAELDAARD